MNKPRSKERGKGKSPSKTAYIHMRVLPLDKARLKLCAVEAGQSLTDYLVNLGLGGGDV
jgi:hypothetical protein